MESHGNVGAMGRLIIGARSTVDGFPWKEDAGAIFRAQCMNNVSLPCVIPKSCVMRLWTRSAANEGRIEILTLNDPCGTPAV
jgi:hypothetical protein